MPRRLLSLLAATTTLGALLLASGPATATAAAPATTPAAAAAGTITAYAVDYGPDDLYTYDSQFVPTSGTETGDDMPVAGVVIGGTDPVAGFGNTAFRPASGTVFAPGTYAVGTGSTDATVSMSHAGSGQCPSDPYPTGTLTVHEVTYDAGAVTSFAGTASLTCSTGQPIAMELRWNSTVPVTRLVAAVNTASPTRTISVPVTTETTFGTATLTGLAGAAIVSDTCSGATVAAGGSCAIGLRATPTTFVPTQGTVALPDGAAGAQHPVTIVGQETAKGAYTALAPKRLLDTRSKIGVGTTTPIGAGKYIDLQVTKRGGVPSTGPAAVVLNLTAVKPTSQGYLTVYPTGTSRPKASSVNFNAGWVGANLVTVRLGTGGKVRVHNASGSTHVVADVMGYYHGVSSTATEGTTYGGFRSITPLRLLDTRTTDGWDGQPLGGWSYVDTAFAFNDTVINEHIKAFAVNVTVTKPQGGGFLAAWDGRDGSDSDFPTTSTVNFTKGRTVANMAIVPTRVCGFCTGFPTARSIGILNASNGASHVIVDIVGVYFDNAISDAWRFNPLTAPTRIVDSRIGKGLTSNVGAGQTRTVLTPAPVAGYNTMAVVTNTTAAKPTKNTVLTLWANDGSARPTVSNLNPYAGQLVSAMTMTEVWTRNDFRVHNASGTTPLIIDVAGTMEFYPAQTPPAATASADRSTADHTTGTDLDGGTVLTPRRASSRAFTDR